LSVVVLLIASHERDAGLAAIGFGLERVGDA